MRFHTSLPVTDIESTVQFYTQLFGSEPVKVKADYAKFLPENGNLNISFHKGAASRKAARSAHLGFELPNQAALRALQNRLQSAGLVSRASETSVCCYASQEKFWVTDPTGYEWELYTLLEDTEEKIDASSGCCAPATGEKRSAASCGSDQSRDGCC